MSFRLTLRRLLIAVGCIGAMLGCFGAARESAANFHRWGGAGPFSLLLFLIVLCWARPIEEALFILVCFVAMLLLLATAASVVLSQSWLT